VGVLSVEVRPALSKVSRGKLLPGGKVVSGDPDGLRVVCGSDHVHPDDDREQHDQDATNQPPVEPSRTTNPACGRRLRGCLQQ
jgi:hypothetical protein